MAIPNNSTPTNQNPLASTGIERFRVLYLKGAQERRSPWFYSIERARKCRATLAQKYGRAIVLRD